MQDEVQGTSTRPLSIRRVLSGFAILAVAKVVSQAIGFAALAIAARRLGPENLGPWNFAISLALYFAIPVDFGISILAIRDIARTPERIREIIGEVMALQAVLAGVAFGAIVALAPVLAADDKAQRLLPIAGTIVLINYAVSLEWALRATQRMGAVAVAQLAGQALYGTLVALFVVEGFTGAIRLGWFYVIGGAVSASLAAWFIWRGGHRPRFSFEPRRLGRRLLASLPIGFSFAMIQIYYSADSLMLGYLEDTAAVGQYAVAYRIPLAIIAFAALWVAALYPHASALYVRDREALRRQVGLFASLALAVGLPLGVGVTIAGEGLMPELFGERFTPAGDPFVLLTWAVVVIIVSVNLGNVLLACGDERRYAAGVTMGALVNIAINLAVIPPFGTVGAASATIAAEALVLAYMVRRFSVVLGPLRLEWERILRAVGATAVMAAVLLLVPESWNVLARLGVGAAVYAVAAIALRVVRREELGALLPRRGAVEPGADAAPASASSA